MTNKKIVLIGRTGQGKSALANVLSGGTGIVKILEEGKKIEELKGIENGVLKESVSSKSETRKIQTVEFKHEKDGKETTYQIVDSIGIGDTQMTKSQVLHEIAQGYEIIKDGVHQVLFVNGERFTPEEIEAYNLLKGFFFDERIDQYTTIVRTKFTDFEDENECKKDIELLLAENNPAITKMINSCKEIIHIDNPSISIKGSGKRIERQITSNKWS